MKTFKSSSFSREVHGNRAEAIRQAIAYLSAMSNIRDFIGCRFTWRADDESGFTIRVDGNGTPYLIHKWNAARN